MPQGELFDTTSSSPDSPVNLIQWPEIVAGALMSETDGDLLSKLSKEVLPVGFYSRTSAICSQVKTDDISDDASQTWRGSGMAFRGECLTLNISESPKLAVDCSLLDVLETSEVPPEYYLSPKACSGILRRASENGNVLHLRQALTEIAQGGDNATTKT